jgi:hypothetical protein
MDWVIYTLSDPRTKKVRYVGFTSRKCGQRLSAHLHEAVYGRKQSHRTNWILSLLCIGLKPVMEVIESGTGDAWKDAECRWIAHFRANGAKLVNGTDGGDGIIGWGTPEQRSAVARKNAAAKTPEERSEIARKRQAAKTPEERSAAGRKGAAAMTPEQRSERARKREAAMNPEQRSERSRKAAAKKTPEARSERARKREAAKTPEQRSAKARKGAATQAIKRMLLVQSAAAPVEPAD